MLETIGTESPEVRTPVAPAVGELAFRIRGGDLQGRIARVRVAKCTIGAAPDCTLRLSEPGVRPLHCVIFRSEAGATVRRWSPDTLLNGRAFSDALLMVGDRLQIGPVELEVIDDAVLTSPRLPRSAAPTAAPAIPVASLAGEIVEHLKRDLDPKQNASKLQRERKRVRQARLRVKRLKLKLAQLQEASLRLQSEGERFQRELEDAHARRLAADRQLQRLTEDGLSSNAARDQLRREADDARHRLEREITAAGENRKRLEQSLDEVRARLAQRDTEVAELRHELNQRLDEWRHERADLQLALEHQQKRSDEFEQAQQAETSQRQQEQAAWQQERLSLLQSLEDKQQAEQRLEAALAELRKAVDQEQLAVGTERQELHTEREQLQQRAAELDQLRQWCEEVEQRAQQAARDEAAAQNEALRLRDRVAELEALTANPSNPATAGSSDDTELRQQLATARRAQSKAESEHERLAQELQQALQEAHAARQEQASLQAKYDQLAADLAERDSRLSSQTEELAGLKHQTADLESRCQELQGLLDSRSAEQWSLLERIEQLEQQASQVANPAEPAQSDVNNQQARIEELEAELLQKEVELVAAGAQVEETSRQFAERDASWAKREQDLLRQLQCVENLARNLEENLRSATDPDAAEQASADKLELERQLATTQAKLSSAQTQWNEQREVLEEQALSANQQVLTLEEQLNTAHQSLEVSHSQLQQRDDLLAQLRDEVRQQMAAWQQERNQLQQELEQVRLEAQHVEAQSFESPVVDADGEDDRAVEPFAHFTEAVVRPPSEVSYLDEHDSRSLVSREAVLSRLEDAEDFTDEPTASEPCPPEAPVKVDDVLARLGAAGIWREEASDQPHTTETDALRDECIAEERSEIEPEFQPEVRNESHDDQELQPASSWYSSQVEATPTEDEQVELSAEPYHAAQSASAFEPPQPEANDAASEDEDSIEAYMARLLKRVRGEAVANAFVQQAPPEPAVEVPQATSRSEVEPQAEPAVTSEEFVPRSQAPEQQVDLAAMRELAIHSARQAITQSTQRRRRQATLATSGIAVGSILGSATLFYWGWQTGNMLAYAGAVGTLTGGICWSIRRIRRAPRTRANTAPVK